MVVFRSHHPFAPIPGSLSNLSIFGAPRGWGWEREKTGEVGVGGGGGGGGGGEGGHDKAQESPHNNFFCLFENANCTVGDKKEDEE